MPIDSNSAEKKLLIWFIVILIFGSFLLVLQSSKTNDTFMIHAIHKEAFACIEHWEGQFESVGDALGTDCVIKGWYQDEHRLFLRPYKNNGFENEDWFGFNKEVLAPCDCTVEKIHINSKTNQPGIMNPSQASSITFKTTDDSYVVLAHVREILVQEGQRIKRGQVVAKVGNNGYSRNPHIHVGAWDKEFKPLQIRFDQTTIGLLTKEEMKKK